MRIHILQHVVFEDAGVVEEIAAETAYPVSFTRFFESFYLPDPDHFDVLVIMGGPMNIFEEEKYPWLAAEKEFIQRCIRAKKKILGICLGSQLLADALGADVYRNPEKEIGWYPVSKHPDGTHDLLKLFPDKLPAFHWHGDTFDLPEGAYPIFTSEATRYQGFIMNDLWIGLQFHWETLPRSVEALLHFAADDLTPGKYVQSLETIRQKKNHFSEIKKSLRLLLNYLQQK
ncbi:MAG: type 1 glutamine amidotransferase [Bacteroidales bacterium]|nr:type 1 glutamine amidotransferase [Bacteroidales bacterium]